MNKLLTFRYLLIFTYISDSPDQTLDSGIKERLNILTVNCTVAYMAQCMSSNKCKETCRSMGSSSYRYEY